MINNVNIRSERFVNVLYPKLNEHEDRITMCAVASAQYINYLCEKGLFFCSDKKDLHLNVLNIIENHFKFEIPEFIKYGLLDIMQEIKFYDYENISPIIKKVNESF